MRPRVPRSACYTAPVCVDRRTALGVTPVRSSTTPWIGGPIPHSSLGLVRTLPPRQCFRTTSPSRTTLRNRRSTETEIDAAATGVSTLMASDHGTLSNASSERRSHHAPTEAEAKVRPSARIRMRAPPLRGEKRTRRIAADRPTPRQSPRLITRTSSPSRTLRANSMSSWRAHAPTTPTPSNTSIRTASSSSAFYDGPAGQRMKKA